MYQYVPGSGIYTVDSTYLRSQLAAIHLIQSGDRIAIIDTGTQLSVPRVGEALAALGLAYRNVDLIVLTHVHLDHAGGAGALMQLAGNAKLVVHPKGARHMVDPVKLVAGAKAVYGESEFNRLYGEVSPVEEARIVQPEDGETIDFAGRPLTFIDTPGHASHHHCIVDTQTSSIFSGDTMGVGYQALRSEGHAYVTISTTPVQFNPTDLHRSIDRVMSWNPRNLYLTHYSHLAPSSRIVAGLHEQIDDYVALTEQAAQMEADTFEDNLTQLLKDYLVRRARNELPQISEALASEWLSLDARLNAQGLAFWWQYRRAA